MSPTGADFLSRIAAKAVGDAVLVEPRLASRFEAAAGGGDWLAGWSEEPAPVAAGAAWLEAPPRPSLARQPAPEADPAQAPDAEAGDPVPARTAPDRAKVGPRPAEPEPGAPARAASAPDSSPPSLAARTEVALAVVDGAPLLIPPPEPLPRERRMEAEPPADVSASLVAPPARESEGAPARRAGPARAESPRSSRPAPPVLTPQPSARALAVPARSSEVRPKPSRRERAAPGVVPPPPPVINITIGRVDVRAPAPAAPAARPSPPTRIAPQSLADYLKRRGGGR